MLGCAKGAPVGAPPMAIHQASSQMIWHHAFIGMHHKKGQSKCRNATYHWMTPVSKLYSVFRWLASHLRSGTGRGTP